MKGPKIWLTVQDGDLMLSVGLSRGELCDLMEGALRMYQDTPEEDLGSTAWYRRISGKLELALSGYDDLGSR